MMAPSLFRRMAAWIYEGLLLFALCALTALSFGYLTNSTHALAHRVELQILLFFVIGIYFSWFWSKGQTLAMKTWRFTITDTLGRPISIRIAALRYLLSWLWFAPPLIALAITDLNKTRLYTVMVGWLAAYIAMAWLHPSKQFLHDRLAGTRLVQLKHE
jgi:uncharacterized RDD family membrane protein YckC